MITFIIQRLWVYNILSSSINNRFLYQALGGEVNEAMKKTKFYSYRYRASSVNLTVPIKVMHGCEVVKYEGCLFEFNKYLQ